MKNTIVSTLFLVMLSSSLVNADENIKMTDEELIAKIMGLDKKIDDEQQKQEKIKAKTKALEKLEKTVDKLAKTLQVDK